MQKKFRLCNTIVNIKNVHFNYVSFIFFPIHTNWVFRALLCMDDSNILYCQNSNKTISIRLWKRILYRLYNFYTLKEFKVELNKNLSLFFVVKYLLLKTVSMKPKTRWLILGSSSRAPCSIGVNLCPRTSLGPTAQKVSCLFVLLLNCQT